MSHKASTLPGEGGESPEQGDPQGLQRFRGAGQVAETPLWREACRLRREQWGDGVFLRGIVEFSNHCGQNCLYCGLRRDNTALVRYRLEPEAILTLARRVHALGISTVVLQSGEDFWYSPPVLAGLIRRIKDELGLTVTLSLGEREHKDYTLWRRAGADRYLLKMETFCPKTYSRLRPGRRLPERLAALSHLADCGYELGSGLIAGLPHHADPAQLENDFTALALWPLAMVSISPFTPHPATPLGGCGAAGLDMILQAMARARVDFPAAHIPVTSALGLHGDAVRLAALEVGDVLMPSLTPEHVRSAYAIYPGKNADTREPAARAQAMKTMLLKAGFSVL